MTDVILHSIRISYDETNEYVREFVDYLKKFKSKKDILAYYHNSINMPKGEIYKINRAGQDFIFICSNNHSCILKLRGT